MKITTLPLSLALVAFPLSAFAQVTWDGGDPADPNASGDWSVPANWDTGALPISGDNVALPSVTDNSTRTITQDIGGGTSINRITLTQDADDGVGVNQLSLGGDLNLGVSSSTAGGTAYSAELLNGAGKSQVALDLNGFKVVAANSSSGIRVGGTVNFNVDDSAISLFTTTHTSFLVEGDLVATANGFIGRDVGTSLIASGTPTVTILSTGSINVTSGEMEVGVRGYHNTTDTLNVTNNGEISIESAGTLRVGWNATPRYSTANAPVTLNNNAGGSLIHEGGLSLQTMQRPSSTPQITVNNNSTWTLSGSSAEVTRLTTAGNASYIAVPEFNNNAAGVLTGSSAADALEFNEQVALGNRMTISNSGLITPGDGSQGSGLSSVGTLTLRDINLTSGDGSLINLDFGGAGIGQFDQIILASGLTDPAGAGTLDLSATNDTLNLFTVDAFAPSNSFSVSLFTAGDVIGTFDSITLNSVAFTANQLEVTEGTYSIAYTGSSVDFAFAPIPEPSTVAFIMGALAIGLVVRSRRRAP